MALSPWHVASRMSSEDVAALLAGFDISLAETGDVHDHEKEFEEWRRVITDAARDGELSPCFVQVYTRDLVQEHTKDPYNDYGRIFITNWPPSLDDSWRRLPYTPKYT
ncbi:hypothetical protein [Kushneria phosphatilytica]|uniref:hypothetical protein n=1 Tax=Kushneria phosphatilytica TaxID=657387 RepID=UPI0008D941A5|nr:hypothetical protein [Kushneria phosphatilytica]